MASSRSSKDINQAEDLSKSSLAQPATTSGPSHAESWLFHQRSTSDHSQTTTHLSQAMIGPTSTFYDPDNISASQDAHEYQSWLDAYDHGQEQQQHQLSTAYHQQVQIPSVVQNGYHFVPGQPASTIAIASSDYSNGHISIPPSNPNSTGASSLPTALPYERPDLYFYPPSELYQHTSDDTSPTTPTVYRPSHTVYEPTVMPASTSAVRTPYPARPGTYATYPEFLALPSRHPHSHSHSNSSVSPSSWTEDTPNSTTSGNASLSSASRPIQNTTPLRPGLTTGKKGPKPSPPTASASAGKGKRKRQKKNDGGDRESGSDTDEEQEKYEPSGLSAVVGGIGSMGGPDPIQVTRLQGACTVCKRLKMKCDFPPGENTCKRCKVGKHVCVVEGRKPRTAPNKREYLLAQIRQKDAVIESLLKQLHNPYIATPLSIASYRMATSPSDHNNSDIVSWLDRLQATIQPPQGKGGLHAFKLDSRVLADVHRDDDSDDGSDHKFGVSDEARDAADADPDPEKLQSLPDASVPLGLIANLSISNTKAKNNGRGRPKVDTDPADLDEDDDDVGVANETYFMPGPASDLGMRASLIERHSPPEILVHGLVTPADVDKLFDIFYTRVNPFISLLDPVLHTPSSTFARCPFLFTVICAISSRYYAEKSEIYPIAMHFAKHSAANALIDGWKSVELCQAYIMMSIYAVPAKRWEEDRSWLYTGLAIRIATDLNLHQVSTAKPQNERQEREILNRTRVWMICFNLDRSTATQFGKPVTIKEDFIMRNSKEWYKKSQYNLLHDVHLCAYSSLLRIVALFHDAIFSDPNTPSGLNNSVDFRAVTMEHDDHLTRYHEEWSTIFAQESDPNDRSSAFRCTLLPFLVGYSRLVMFSFGFQQAFQRGIEPGDHVFFTKCLDAAKSVLKNMIDVLAPSGYMRYAPDGHFIFASFASAFLLKLLRPDFSHLLSKEQEGEIFDLIGRLIQTFSSPEIAIDDRHTPRLYARFLAGLLSRHRRDGSAVGRHHQQPPPRSSLGDYPAKPTTSSFSVAQPSVIGIQPQQQHDVNGVNGYTPSLYSQSEKSNTNTPTYQGENGYVPSSTPTTFDMSSDFGQNYGSPASLSEEEMLATMQALKNPLWWQTMMMPGFSWPEPSSMNGIGYMNNLGMPNGFGSFLPAEVPLQ